MTNSVWEAIKAVDSMAALDAGINRSECSHLQDFLRETLHFWHKIIKDRLTRFSSAHVPLLCSLFNVDKCFRVKTQSFILL